MSSSAPKLENIRPDKAISTIETAWYGERPHTEAASSKNDAPSSDWSFRARGCAELDRRVGARASYGYAYASMASAPSPGALSKIA